ncbi:MAG TPA: sugar phosphate isomerase/epimerase family protein [Opitutaceae bacterium]
MKHNPSRRNFIRYSTGLSVLAAASGSGVPGATAFGQVPFRRAGGCRLKTSLNAFSFNDALSKGKDGSSPEMTLFDVLEFCAEHDFDAIDPTGYYFPDYPKVPSDEYIAKFKKRAFELGLDISGTGIRNNLASPDKAARAADVQLAKAWIDAAVKLGAPVIRLFAGHEKEGADREEVSKWMAEDLRACAEYGKLRGVLVGVQNHNDFLKTAAQTIRIVEMVNSDWLGVILDTGNYHQDPYKEIAAVLPYTVNFQVKESPYGKDSPVRLDLDRFVKIVCDAGYRGYLPIETLTVTGVKYEPLKVIPKFHAEVKAAFDRAV